MKATFSPEKEVMAQAGAVLASFPQVTVLRTENTWRGCLASGRKDGRGKPYFVFLLNIPLSLFGRGGREWRTFRLLVYSPKAHRSRGQSWELGSE